MATEEDWDELLTIVERQVTTWLKEIKQPRQRRTFKKVFIKAVKLRVKSAYSKLDAKLERRSSRDQTGSTFAAENNMNLLGNFGPLRQVKIEPKGDVIELSDEDDDDDDEKLIPKTGCSEVPNERAYHRNQQIETSAGDELLFNHRSIPNEGEAPAIGLMEDSDSEMKSEVANDTPSTSSGMGLKNKDSITNADRSAAVENPKQRGEGSVGAKNVKKAANNKQKKHNCQIFEYATSRKGNLDQHICTHTGERPYQCNKCSTSFVRSAHLEKHQLVHVKQYKFRCVGCARGFNKESEKMAHDEVCGKRRYECYLCKPPHAKRTYATNRITNLKQHMRTHTGEKPLRCEICMRRFGLKSSWKRHLNNVHSRTNR